jgi:hypothetical protein
MAGLEIDNALEDPILEPPPGQLGDETLGRLHQAWFQYFFSSSQTRISASRLESFVSAHPLVIY